MSKSANVKGSVWDHFVHDSEGQTAQCQLCNSQQKLPAVQQEICIDYSPRVQAKDNRNRNLQISKAPLESQAQGTSLFTSAGDKPAETQLVTLVVLTKPMM